MKIVISPDSFKGSLTARQAAKAMKRGCEEAIPGVDIVLKPMADGGEGTLDTLIFATNGKRLHLNCTGPLGKKIETSYGELGDKKTAVIEVASIAGLVQVPKDERDPYKTTSFGLGEAIKHAIGAGYSSIIIGLGGSSSNDGGLGMLQAVGVKFFNEKGEKLNFFGEDVLSVGSVDFSSLDCRLKDVSIRVAADVDNPLCGPNGASAIYGPQKGATPVQIKKLDNALFHYGELIEKAIGKELKETPGAGAAGGLGFALLVLGAEFISGAKLVANTIQLKEEISSADLVITGEGQSDEQTLFGKAPGYVAQIAKASGVPIILISGSLGKNTDSLRELFSGCFSITKGPASLEECIEFGEKLLYEQTKNVVHLINRINK